jgi:hypothetical protein
MKERKRISTGAIEQDEEKSTMVMGRPPGRGAGAPLEPIVAREARAEYKTASGSPRDPHGKYK